MKRVLLIPALAAAATVAFLAWHGGSTGRDPSASRSEQGSIGRDRDELPDLVTGAEAATGSRRAPAVDDGQDPGSAPEGDLSVRIGPRPGGVRVVAGRLAAPRRFGDDDGSAWYERAPDWVEQGPALGIVLTSRDGHRVPAPDLDGSSERAHEPMEVGWRGLPAGIYDLWIELRGDAGSAVTDLTGLAVEEDGTCRDPRLEVWDPMDDFAAMQLSFTFETRADGSFSSRTPGLFVIGVSEGNSGTAYACAPVVESSAAFTPPYGPYLVIRSAGDPATLHAFADTSGETTVPFVPGASTVVLPERLSRLVVPVPTVGEPPPEDCSMLRLERVDEPGAWRPEVPVFVHSYVALTRLGEGMALIGRVPASGLYRYASEDPPWASSPFRIERAAVDTAVKVPVLRPR